MARSTDCRIVVGIIDRRDPNIALNFVRLPTIFADERWLDLIENSEYRGRERSLKFQNTYRSMLRILAIASVVFGGSASELLAQQADSAASPSDVNQPSTASAASAPDNGFSSFTNLPARRLAPGVLVTVPPNQSSGDMTIGPQDLDFVRAHPELEWAPPSFPEGKPNTFAKSETLLEMGREVTLRHPVWALEFSFKPVRTIMAPVVTAAGTVEDQLVWYMVYRVRYVGGDLFPNETSVEAGTGVPNQPKRVMYKSVRFLPRFTLVAPEVNAEYDSQIISTAKAAIANRERVGKPLHDYVEISNIEIKPIGESSDNSVWGLVTWTGIDPRIDAFYVDVKGLTNAYQREIDAQGKPVYKRKTLRLYFWKPGDTIDQQADRIQLGLPAFESPERQQHVLKLFNISEPLDYSWIYR